MDRKKVLSLVYYLVWPRAVSLKVSMESDTTTEEFLRSFQLHAFDIGVPQLVLCDLGSQLVACAYVISIFLHDPNVGANLKKNNETRLDSNNTVRVTIN